jgi:hypothetical protein
MAITDVVTSIDVDEGPELIARFREEGHAAATAAHAALTSK